MLDYTRPPLQFLIGSFDASQYLDSISLSVPMHEPNQALLWSGRFTVSWNLAAKMAGVTEDYFSERTNPTLWRPYQQQVRLNIRGFQSPVFRIENYRFNRDTDTGEGILTQVPTGVAGDRPGQLIPTTVAGSISQAIGELLAAAFTGATVVPGRAIAGDGGVLDVPLSSRSPWEDAVRLSSLNWKWLAVNTAETIYSVDGSGGAIVFTRDRDRAEVVPDLDALYQSANKVIVTGARQVPDPGSPTTTLPTVPRPKFKTTTENRPIGTIFSSLGTNVTPAVFEQKTIIYQYWDDDSWLPYVPIGVNLTAFLFDIQTVAQSGIDPFGDPPPDLTVPLQTITIKLQPIGYLFPSLGTDATLVAAEVLVESSLRKLTIKPEGVLFPSLSPSATLVVEKRESLTSAAIPPGAALAAPPPGGVPLAYEPRPRLEAPQPAPARPLKTEVLKGEALLSPIGWTPILPNKPLVVDFGFLPDQSRAQFLAQQIAAREQYRREQSLVDMPIPDEWLSAGWPLLARCRIGGDVFLMDGCAIEIKDGIAKFGFTGARVGSYALTPAGVPTGDIIPIFNPKNEISIGVKVRMNAVSVLLDPVGTVTNSVTIGVKTHLSSTSVIAVTNSVTIGVKTHLSSTNALALSNLATIGVKARLSSTSAVNAADPFWANVTFLLRADANGFSDLKGAALVSAGATVSTIAAFGHAVYMNTGSISIPNSAGLISPTGDWTIEWFAREISTTAFAAIFMLDGTDYPLGIYRLQTRADYFAAVGSNFAWDLSDIPMGATDTTQAHYFGLKREGATISAWRDGVEITNLALPVSTAIGIPASNAVIANNQGFPWNGYLEEFRITNGVARDLSIIPTAKFPTT